MLLCISQIRSPEALCGIESRPVHDIILKQHFSESGLCFLVGDCAIIYLSGMKNKAKIIRNKD